MPVGKNLKNIMKKTNPEETLQFGDHHHYLGDVKQHFD